MPERGGVVGGGVRVERRGGEDGREPSAQRGRCPPPAPARAPRSVPPPRPRPQGPTRPSLRPLPRPPWPPSPAPRARSGKKGSAQTWAVSLNAKKHSRHLKTTSGVPVTRARFLAGSVACHTEVCAQLARITSLGTRKWVASGSCLQTGSSAVGGHPLPGRDAGAVEQRSQARPGAPACASSGQFQGQAHAWPTSPWPGPAHSPDVRNSRLGASPNMNAIPCTL